MPKVAILAGSRSDVPTLDACVETLVELGIEHELHVMSAHRAPAKVQALQIRADEDVHARQRLRAIGADQLREAGLGGGQAGDGFQAELHTTGVYPAPGPPPPPRRCDTRLAGEVVR